MNIKTILDDCTYPYLALRLVFPLKEYIFSTCADKADTLDKDFIFIPLAIDENEILDTVKKVFKNEHCKGFVLNKNLIDKIELQKNFHIFMEDLDADPEVLLLVNNIYNFANYIAYKKTNECNFETIAIVGTDKTSVIRDILVDNLKSQNISYAESNLNYWQLLYEPILLANNDTKYAIVEVKPDKPEVTLCASRFNKKHILFTRSTLYKMNNYSDLDDLSDSIVNVLLEPKKVLSVFSPDYNGLVNDKIPYQYTKIAHFIPTDNKACEKLKKEYAFAFEFLKHIGITPDDSSKLKMNFPLYSLYQYNNAEYLVMNKERVLFENVKTAVKLFAKKYNDRKKIIIYEHIKGLGIYKRPCTRELFKLFAEVNPEVLLLVNITNSNHFYNRNENDTYLKNLPYDPNSKESKVKLRHFVKAMAEPGSAVFVASESDLSFLFGSDI